MQAESNQRKAQNKRDQRARDKAQGLIEFRVLIHKDDKQAVSDYARELRSARGIDR